MGRKVQTATLLGLSLVLVNVMLLQAQEPNAAATPKTGTTAERSREEPPGKAAETLVEQLRRYPARPSTAAGQLGLFLIDANGGEATLIANEPDPWLDKCGSPAWSHDGKRILFHATNEGVGFGRVQAIMSRLKALDLVDGRLETKDLGPGSSCDLSPSDDRVIFQLKPGSLAGPQTGVWIMKIDGSERRFLSGDGQPRWSPDGHQFLIIGSTDPCVVTVIDDRPGQKSGLLQIPNLKIFSVPSWAGPGTIVAVIGEDTADTIALVDVTEPEQAKVKEVLWHQGQGLDVKPSFPIYSPSTRQCVVVADAGNGKALYSLLHGKPGTPKRLEPQATDKTIQDLTFSPDGRYVVFASDRKQIARSPSVRPQSVDAPALSGITIDGDLSDWPAAMPRHAIQNLHAFPTITGPGRREQAFLSTSADLSAAFSVGYDPKEQLIYVAVIVRDDQLVVGNTSAWDTDAVEVYVDGLHTEEAKAFPQDPNWTDNMDAGEAPVLQYIGIPGKPPVYGVKKSAGQERSGEDNPILMFGDIKKTKTKMAFRRQGDVTIYEWAVQVFDHYPDEPTKLLPGLQIGFDVVVVDKDKPAQTPLAQNEPEEDRQAWVCWGPPWRSIKFFDPGNLGEIVLGRAPSQ